MDTKTRYFMLKDNDGNLNILSEEAMLGDSVTVSSIVAFGTKKQMEVLKQCYLEKQK